MEKFSMSENKVKFCYKVLCVLEKTCLILFCEELKYIYELMSEYYSAL